MSFFQIVGIGLIVCALTVIFRQYKPEYALFVSIVGGLVMLSAILLSAGEAVSYINGLLDRFNIPVEAFAILVKCLGLSYLAKIACDMCTDSGESATASKIELAAKIAILLTALPLFEGLLQIIAGFVQ